MNIALLLALGVVGAVIAGQLNHAIYRWAWDSRPISPWSEAPQKAQPRTWVDRIPVYGWWLLRREVGLHGQGFWIRPLLIELVWLIGLPWFYWWSVVHGGQMGVPPQAAWESSLRATFVANTVLFGLMTIATFIDFDEKMIPDLVTVPGALFGLLFVTIIPGAMLPVNIPPEPILLMPLPWPEILLPPALPGLAIGLVCWLGWCVALLPFTIYFRRGVVFWLRLLIGSILHKRRRRTTLAISVMFLVGTATIGFVWNSGGLRWQAMLSSLVGMAAAGSLVWAIRIVAGGVLRVEAMGFGDVTLMAMIGAFFGWQASLVCFFLAPFTSVGIAAAQWLITGNRQIAFGPYLCAGAAIVMLGWADIWRGWGALFVGQMAVILIVTICVGILLMGVMLWMLQLLKRALGFVA